MTPSTQPLLRNPLGAAAVAARVLTQHGEQESCSCLLADVESLETWWFDARTLTFCCYPETEAAELSGGRQTLTVLLFCLRFKVKQFERKDSTSDSSHWETVAESQQDAAIGDIEKPMPDVFETADDGEPIEADIYLKHKRQEARAKQTDVRILSSRALTMRPLISSHVGAATLAARVLIADNEKEIRSCLLEDVKLSRPPSLALALARFLAIQKGNQSLMAVLE